MNDLPQANLQKVEVLLREHRPIASNTPPDLHESIMMAVRREAGKPAPNPHHRALWWLPAPAFLSLFLAAIFTYWPVRNSPLAPTTVSGAVSSITKGLELATKSAPEQVVAPLAEELQRLRGDLESAKSFLMASLP